MQSGFFMTAILYRKITDKDREVLRVFHGTVSSQLLWDAIADTDVMSRHELLIVVDSDAAYELSASDVSGVPVRIEDV